jgi:hypothetical protein
VASYEYVTIEYAGVFVGGVTGSGSGVGVVEEIFVTFVLSTASEESATQ